MVDPGGAEPPACWEAGQVTPEQIWDSDIPGQGLEALVRKELLGVPHPKNRLNQAFSLGSGFFSSIRSAQS
jgi:hypothetical protein